MRGSRVHRSADGAYAVIGPFRGTDYCADKLASVAVNGSVLFLSPVAVEGEDLPFANIVSLRAGDTIVFSVGSNQQPPQSFSASTGLSVVITTASGNATSFGVVSTENSVSFGKNAKLSAGIGAGTSASLGKDAVVSRDIVANPKNIMLGRGASVTGTCVTNGGKIKLGQGANCSNEDFGFSSDLATTKAASTALGSFETWLAGQTSTQTLAAIILAKEGVGTIEDTVTGQHHLNSVGHA